jgi:hypothetical protein
MKYNAKLLTLLKDNPTAYHEFCKPYPQINHTTKICRTPYYVINVASDFNLKMPPPTFEIPSDGIRALLWRLLGKWVKHKPWTKRGHEKFQPLPPIAYYEKETINLTRFHWMDHIDYIDIATAYVARIDTLFVYTPG